MSKPQPIARRSLVLSCAVVFAIAMGYFSSQHRPPSLAPKPITGATAVPHQATPISSTAPESALPVLPRPTPLNPQVFQSIDPGRSPLADRLNAPDGTIRDDLEILHRVLTNYEQSVGSDPVGNNRDITAQLTGKNPRHHAPIPKGLAAIDAHGELVDRWGTPFFFHALSGHTMQIRSAGPDRDMYTDDDVLWSPVPSTKVTADAGSARERSKSPSQSNSPGRD